MVKTASGIAQLLAGLLIGVPAFAASPDLLLEGEVEPARTHVQTQAIYRLRFYQGVDVRDLKITGPSAPLADFRPIGGSRIYEALREGRRYRVHERSYALFPFASGELKISGARAEARGGVRVEAAPQNLKVLPLPAGAEVAAKALSLSETWSSPLPEGAGVGEIQRRIVRIEAAGVDAGQLPELGFEVPGMAVHAEPARLENHFQGEINIASREQAFNLIPLRSGDLVVPEQRLGWWNVAVGAPAVAILAPRTLRVAAADAGLAIAEEVPVPAGSSSLPMAIVGILGLAGFLAWRRWELVHAAWQLRRACRSGQPAAVRDSLLAWVARHWPERAPLTLGALAEALKDSLARRALADLDRCLYGPGTGPCDADTLAIFVARVKRGVRQQRRA